jgi:hypothetical protein
MLRIALILTTIVVTTVGSLGLPIYLHTCRMIAAETEKAGCAMCDEQDDSRHPVVPATDDDGSCCGSSIVNQRIDPGTSYRAALPMPLVVALAAFVAVELELPADVGTVPCDIGHSPPPLAARTQHAYLLNSTFLI